MYKVSTRLAFKIWEHLVSTHGYVRSLERLSFTMTSNGKREFVPRDQVSPYLSFIVHYFYT